MTGSSLTCPLDHAKPYEVVWDQVKMIFELSRRVIDCAFVYFIGEEDGPIKIGFAKDPIKRVRAMQAGNPRRLRIEHVLIGDMGLEKALHQVWQHLAIVAPSRKNKPDALPGTEWFRAEIREKLDDILITAGLEQLDCVTRTKEIDPADLTSAVLSAHEQHGIVIPGRDEVRLLATGAGYAVQRRSRI